MENRYISIFGFIIKLEFENPVLFPEYTKLFKDILLKQLNGFLVSPQKNVDYTIRFKEELDPEVFYKVNQEKFYILLHQKKLHNKSSTFYYLNYLQFQFVLRKIGQILLAKHTGMYIHASAILINNKAFLFMGKSGAGKSTIAQLLGESFTKIADDTVVIRKIGKKFFIFQTPFMEKNNIDRKISQKYEIGGIYFIKKSKNHSIEEIENKEKIGEMLLKQLFSDMHDTNEQVRTLFLFLNSCKNIHYLYFGLENKQKLMLLLKK